MSNRNAPLINPRPRLSAACARSTFQPFSSDGHIRPLHDIERDVIRVALMLSGGSVGRAARKLGIGRSTLYRKIGSHGPDLPAAPPPPRLEAEPLLGRSFGDGAPKLSLPT